MRQTFLRKHIFSRTFQFYLKWEVSVEPSLTETPLESRVLVPSAECHSKTAAVSEHCHHFSAFNEQCHIAFLSNILSAIPNFWQCSQKNLLEIALNLFPFGDTQINSMEASTRYLGYKMKTFTRISKRIWGRVSRDAVHPGRELIMPG